MRTSFFRSNLIILLGVIFSFHFLFFSLVWGLDYPTKPINLIVSATPGGPTDLQARILAEAASKDLSVPIIIINKAGPGGALAASFVAHEKPDGYTFLVTLSSTMTSNFVVFPNLPYKRTDFIPAFMSMVVPVTVAVRADSPYKSLRDFLDGAKRNPGKLRSGSFSTNISLVWEGLLKREGIQIKHMLYKGAPECLLAVIGGHLDCYCEALTPLVPHLEAGKIHLLAMIGSKRNKNYPEVPTLKELGYSSFARDFWCGFFAPAGLPQPIMDKIVPVFEKALSLPNVQAEIEKASGFAKFMGPKEFANFIDDQYEFYMGVAKELGK